MLFLSTAVLDIGTAYLGLLPLSSSQDYVISILIVCPEMRQVGPRVWYL